MRRKAVIKDLSITHFFYFILAIKIYQIFNYSLEMVKIQGGLSSSTGVEKELHFSYPVVKQISPVLKTLVLNNLDQYQN